MLQPLDGLRRREFASFHRFQNFQQFTLIHNGQADANSNTARGQLFNLTCPDAAARLNLSSRKTWLTRKNRS
jgi:hypothetical protein